MSYKTPKYALVTAAYNEQENIERTILSVTNQSIRPEMWVIVSDGSTDKTDEIINRYCTKENPFIRYVRVEKNQKHCFAAKVSALLRALEVLGNKDRYDYIGILDADVSFRSNYFESLIGKFKDEPTLGVAGGDIVQHVGGRIKKRIKDKGSVAGAVQFFRKTCFEETGGLPLLKYGGEDATIETAAKMKGWRVQTFTEFKVTHYGEVGDGAGGRVKARYIWGKMNYAIGYHPLYQLARSVYRWNERPYVVGSIAELIGFLVSFWEYREPQIDHDVVTYLRKEQLNKLRQIINTK